MSQNATAVPVVGTVSGLTMAQDINLALDTIATYESGSGDPGAIGAYRSWADTGNNLMKQRNAANSGWVVRGSLTEVFAIAKSAGFNVGVGDFGKLFKCTGSFTATATAAATLGDGFWFDVANVGSGTIVFDPNASEQVDGATTISLLPTQSCRVWCDAAGFFTVGRQSSVVPQSFKNRVINGDMRVDSRNETAAAVVTSSNTYNVDRMYARATGANATVQQIAGPSGFQKMARYTGAASNTAVVHGHRIESNQIADYAGQTVTIAAHLKSSSITQVDWSVVYANAADNFGATTAIASGSFTITSSDANFSAAVALPANAANGIQIEFATHTGLLASQTFDVTGMQLELGGAYTAFDYWDLQRQQIACKRYAQWIPFGLRFTAAGAAATLESAITFAEMRVVPTLSTLVGDPTAGGAVSANNSANGVARFSRVGAAMSITSTAAGDCYVLGYRYLLTAEL
jgi:hypothetical protein